MFRRILLAACMFVGMSCRLVVADDIYRVLCTNITAALGNATVLMSSSFTNKMHIYLSSTNVEARSLASLALADSLLARYDNLSDFMAYDEGCLACSNVLFSTELPMRSWKKSVAALFYAWALRIDGKNERAFAVCRTALSSHLASPTTDVECAVWSAMSRIEGGPTELDITNSLRLAAALSVPAESRSSEWGAYTNGLPSQAIQILLE